MKFLLDMEDKRSKEREEDKRLREKERQEDREETRNVIDHCVEEKLNEAIQPLKNETVNVVQAQQQMKEQIDSLSEQMKVLKERVNTIKVVEDTSKQVASGGADLEFAENNPVSVADQTLQMEKQVVSGRGHGGHPDGEQEQELERIIAEARRTVGLFRIDQADLHRMRQSQFGGAESPEEEKLLAVREYLKLELKLDPKMIEKMEIEKIFYTTRDNPECIFVTFKHRSSVSRIFEKTYIMRKESRVKNYIPKQFMDRARALAEIEHKLREGDKFRTKVKMGIKDLELFRKERYGGKWELVPVILAELPPVDMGLSGNARGTETGSPAPGRPCQSRTEKRSRESTGSPSGSNPKTARKGSNTEGNGELNGKGDAWVKALEEADLVSDTAQASPTKDGAVLVKQLDLGIISSISGTPAKSPLNSNPADSPIFSRKQAKSSN